MLLAEEDMKEKCDGGGGCGCEFPDVSKLPEEEVIKNLRERG